MVFNMLKSPQFFNMTIIKPYLKPILHSSHQSFALSLRSCSQTSSQRLYFWYSVSWPPLSQTCFSLASTSITSQKLLCQDACRCSYGLIQWTLFRPHLSPEPLTLLTMTSLWKHPLHFASKTARSWCPFYLTENFF